jgi:hypothetical protein
MSIIGFVFVVGFLVAGYAAYQLYKNHKAVTAANVLAQAKADAATVQSDVKKS